MTSQSNAKMGFYNTKKKENIQRLEEIHPMDIGEI
jgi:hypothetical protein